jgi:hypothetical protein
MALSRGIDLGINFEVAGVKGRVIPQGPHSDEVHEFLSGYLRPFPVLSARDPDFEVNLHAPEGELSSPHHPAWNDPSEEFRVFGPGIDESQWVIQRDFVATVDPTGSRAWSVGPRVDHGAIDTIDNLLAFLVSRKLIHHSALLVHAATVERGSGAYVFFGASGAGKSTLAKHCHDVDGLRALSGDQIYLQWRDPGVVAHPCPTTIPDFPRDHPGWCPEPRPVRALIHLVQSGGWSFRRLSQVEALTAFLSEVIYQPRFGNAERVLQLAAGMVENSSIPVLEMSYPKGQSFWSRLLVETNGELGSTE